MYHCQYYASLLFSFQSGKSQVKKKKIYIHSESVSTSSSDKIYSPLSRRHNTLHSIPKPNPRTVSDTQLEYIRHAPFQTWLAPNPYASTSVSMVFSIFHQATEQLFPVWVRGTSGSEKLARQGYWQWSTGHVEVVLWSCQRMSCQLDLTIIDH